MTTLARARTFGFGLGAGLVAIALGVAVLARQERALQEAEATDRGDMRVEDVHPRRHLRAV